MELHFPGFYPAPFFGLCCILGYSATRIFRSKLKGKGKNFTTKHQPSWLASASPFFLLSLLPLSLSLSVCHLCLVYSIQKCLRCCLRLSGQFFRVSELWGFIVIYCAIWFCHLRTPLAWGTLLQPVVLHSNNYNVAWRLCHFSWVCQPSLASENCPVGSPSEILLLKLQGFCICSSGHKEHIASNALVLHAKCCLQAVLEKAVGSVARGCSLVCAMLFHAISFLYFKINKRMVVQPCVSCYFSWKAKCNFYFTEEVSGDPVSELVRNLCQHFPPVNTCKAPQHCLQEPATNVLICCSYTWNAAKSIHTPQCLQAESGVKKS